MSQDTAQLISHQHLCGAFPVYMLMLSLYSSMCTN